jgi:hypothetical protein
MFWKLFSLQRLLDSLFDDGWLALGLTRERQATEHEDAQLQAQQA